MARKGKYRREGRTGGGSYRYDDYYKIRLVMFLFANPESNRNQMKLNKESGLSSMEGGKMTSLLETMVEDGWIKKFESTHTTGRIVYTLEEKGRKVAELIKKLLEESEHTPLFDLDCFRGVKLLGSKTF